MTDTVLPSDSDTPTTRATVLELDDDVMVTMMEALRERRMRAYLEYQAHEELLRTTKMDKLRIVIEKHLIQFEKKAISTGKAIDAMEDRLRKIRIARLEYGELEIPEAEHIPLPAKEGG